jgi:hypothetical protein
MDLGLTTGKYQNMTDTNKLLYLIYGEVKRIREVFDTAQVGSLVGDSKRGNINVQEMQKNIVVGQIEVPESKEGHKCKYCGEFVEGNKGKLLAHIRKCPKRTEGK